MIYKLDLFEQHLSWVCRVLDTWLAMDRAFAFRARGEDQSMLDAFDAMCDSFAAGLGIIRDTVKRMAESRHTETDSERYLFFRYQVRCLNPAEAFAPFLTNLPTSTTALRRTGSRFTVVAPAILHIREPESKRIRKIAVALGTGTKMTPLKWNTMITMMHLCGTCAAAEPFEGHARRRPRKLHAHP